MQELSRYHRFALLLAALAAALPARALVLGEVEVRSALGEPLEARIGLDVERGQTAVGACFALQREASDASAPAIGEGILNVEHRSNGTKALRVRTLKPVVDPAVTLNLRFACPGDAAEPVRRSYTLLLDPRPAPRVASPRLPVIGARLDSRAADSLDAIAAKIFPSDAAARRDYAAALRLLNPAIAARSDAAVATGEAVALPDLRAFPRSSEPRSAAATAPPSQPAAAPKPVPMRSATAPKPAPPPSPAAPRPAPKASAAPASPPPSPAATPAPAAAPKARVANQNAPPSAPGAGFVLRLSSGEIDLSRSRKIDDRMRAQLRERLLVLDADDQVAALLSMRDSLKRLEARVAELQLKLSAMPASLATAVPPSAPPKVSLPASAAAPAAKPVAPPTAPLATPSPPSVATPSPPTATAPPPAAGPPPAATTPPATTPPATAAPRTRAAARPDTPQAASGLPDWLWAIAGLFIVLALALAYGLWRRSRAADAPAVWDEVPDEAALPEAAEASAADEGMFEVAPEVRAEMASDAELETRLPQDSNELRRRYIEERFPEIQNRTVVLEDPASVVKGARLFYEDGATPRAVELLQFATEDNPGEVRTWLALFEILRLERGSEEYAALATRFHAQHGEGEHWRKVQFFGREIDPGNPVYRDPGVNTLETIGPREAKRLAAGLTSVGHVDPVAENWLEAPMDFENEVLANDLRKSLMGDAGLVEDDLVPNPMPALRSVEMFTVA